MPVNRIFTGVCSVIALASVFYAWNKTPDVVTRKEFIKVPEIREVIKIQKIRVPVKEVIVLDKQEAVLKLKLPDEVVNNTDKQIIATGTVPPYKGETDVIAALNTETGESEILAKKRPLPLFGFLNKKEIGVRYGVSTETMPYAELYGRWQFFRLGNFQAGAYGSVDSTAEAKVLLDVNYEF